MGILRTKYTLRRRDFCGLVFLVCLASAPASTAAAATVDAATLEVDAELSPEAVAAGTESAAQSEATAPIAAPSAREILTREWNQPGRTLAGRISATRDRLVELGMVGFPPAARALILDPTLGDAGVRADGAVELAPNLPDAHAFRAAVLFEDKQFVAAAKAWLRSVLASERHFEGGLWIRGHAFAWLALTLTLGGALYLLVAGTVALPRLAVHFSGPERRMPLAAGVATLLLLAVLPGVLGFGVLGMLLALGCIGLAAGSGVQRLCIGVAGAACLFGTFPVLDASVRNFGMVGTDPVAEAAYNIDWETASEIDLARVRTDDVDPLARRALATWDRRRGRLQSALDRYDGLLGAQAGTGALNNAANLRLSLGEPEAAIALYERAAKQSRDPAILINLAEAYGRTIRLDEQNLALAEAQLIDAETVEELTRGEAATRLRDIGIGAGEVRERIALQPYHSDAAFLRVGVTPHFVEDRWMFLLAVFGGLTLVAIALGNWLPDGRPVCEYLDARAEQTHGHGGTTDPFERVNRAAENRGRKKRLRFVSLILGVLIPGAAALIARKPLRGFITLTGFVGALAAWFLRVGLFPDPLASGFVLYSLALATAAIALAVFTWSTLTSLVVLWRD
ncbi:MAG: hypothetical protein HKP27_14605 [Myxococcales bacterium]|nr:hypothetical protein [Myxococcales bacterium]